MATRKVLLDEDVTGLNINNFIELEKVITTASRDRLVVLEYGSFFTNNLVIVDKHYNVIDPSKYMFCDLYQEACMKSGKEVWNAIIILEEDTPTELYISYFAYGGKFSTNGRR